MIKVSPLPYGITVNQSRCVIDTIESNLLSRDILNLVIPNYCLDSRRRKFRQIDFPLISRSRIIYYIALRYPHDSLSPYYKWSRSGAWINGEKYLDNFRSCNNAKPVLALNRILLTAVQDPAICLKKVKIEWRRNDLSLSLSIYLDSSNIQFALYWRTDISEEREYRMSIRVEPYYTSYRSWEPEN